MSSNLIATPLAQQAALKRRLRSVSSRRLLVLVALGALLIVVCILSLGVGRYSISTSTIVSILANVLGFPPAMALDGNWSQQEWIVVTQVRLPRVIIASIAGMGLGLCGSVLQGLFRNPLVGPDIVGVTHGAAFGGVCAILLGFSAMGVVFNAVIGGLTALTLCFILAKRAGANTLTLVLSGIIISAFFGACIGVVQYLANPETTLPSIIHWLLGSFSNSDWTKVGIIAVPFVAAAPLLMLLGWRLNILSLDDLDASALGVRVTHLRWLMIVLVTLILAAQVAVSGGIGWVGIVVPHFARMLFGADHRFQLPTATVLGGLFVVIVDDLARTLAGQDLPIGILTALVGTPIFAWLFWTSSKRGWKPD